MTINLSLQQSYGPPGFYEPRLPVPPASLREIQLATSLVERTFLKNWVDQPNNIEDPDEWVHLLFFLSILAHFDQNWVWDAIFPSLPKIYQLFSSVGLADKTPIALYWPNILAPIFYHHPSEKRIVDLGRAIFQASDNVSRAGVMKMLCLSRDEVTAKYAMDTLKLALRDRNAIVRTEAILSLVKCGPIPVATSEALEACLNHPRTSLPAASALFHMTGVREYFVILQEAAENRNSEVAIEAAHALEPWPTRQCVIESCHAPLRFKDYWMVWRKHVTPSNFWDAYQLWRSPAVKFFCCQCYKNLDSTHSDFDSTDSE